MLQREAESELLPADNRMDNIEYQDLFNFLESWDIDYAEKVKAIPLFDADKTAQWSLQQKTHFVKVLYHCRGHFHELLWFLACYAPDKNFKRIVIENILDELGTDGFSHEELYSFSAKAVGVDVKKEYIDHETYLPFCKEFNRGHLQWLNEHDWDGKVAAFAALERLDNIDYVKGKALAESIGLKGKELTFFNVHIHVDHFGSVLKSSMLDVWKRNALAVKEAFSFISKHQVKMWSDLSDEIFNYA